MIINGKRYKLKKSIKKKIKQITYCFVLIVLLSEPLPIRSINAEEIKSEKIYTVLKDYKSGTEHIKEDLINEYIKERNLDINEINLEKSIIHIHKNETYGLQKANVSIDINFNNGEKSVINEIEKEILIEVVHNNGPTLRLVNDYIIVNKDSQINLSSFIGYIDSELNQLPTIKIEGEVDTSKEGVYTVVYTAVDAMGRSVNEVLEVEVKEHPEIKEAREEIEKIEKKIDETIGKIKHNDDKVINEIKEEYQNISEFAKTEIENKIDENIEKLEKELRVKKEEYKREEERKKAVQINTPSVNYSRSTPIVGGGSNPYYGGWSNCTWGAWQLAHDIHGVNLPGWGNAVTWYNSAAASGYSVGQTPRAGSIVVSNNHVAYVTQVSGGNIYVREGGWYGREYHEGWTSTAGKIGYIYLP